MRVLHVLPTRALEYGGPVRVAAALCEQLTRMGHRAGIFPENALPSWAARIGYWPGLRAIRDLQTAVRDVDIVHVHGLWTAPTSLAARLAASLQRPFVIAPHGMLDRWSLRRNSGRKKLYAAILERRNLESAAAIHFFNDEERREAQAFGISAPTFLLPNGVHPALYESLPGRDALWERYPETAGRKVVLFLGRLHPKKGLPVLIEAFAAAAGKRDDLHLLVAGPDELGHRSQLERLVARESIGTRVTFTGAVDGDSKRLFLGGADVFVLPSHQEGDSMAVKEAMASGLPVIVTAACHLPEVNTYQAGIVTEPRAGDLEQALLALCENAPRRATMGRNARSLIQDRYRWDLIGVELVRQYERILGA